MLSQNIVIGIDEVGRGPWAGPLLVGAVALDMNLHYQGLKDSKKLTAKSRQRLSHYIKANAIAIGLGWVNASVIDNLGLTKALKLGAVLAMAQIPDSVQKIANRIVIDGNINMLDNPKAQVMIKADSQISAVSAASIVAKVSRDNYMIALDKIFPEYNFSKHKGYGTLGHRQSIEQHGIIDGIHRQSFRPIFSLGQNSAKESPRTPKNIGYVAEDIATDYLLEKGFSIIARNWRSKTSEIDIIASKAKTIYFVEVKYRQKDSYGDGLEAITPSKLTRIKKGIDLFLLKNSNFADLNPQICAIAMTGNPPTVKDFLLIKQ